MLDLIENFTRFSDSMGGVSKLLAKNHQFLGVNRAVEALRVSTDGRIGVFWHTQGSGKSYSMVFFAEKVFRKLRGNWTFVVITDRRDEAHRSQYDTLAMNMRTALPNAKFVAFTGTPLIVGEERTREVFGDYVSVYNFRQSVEDGATVPLFYENRTPELQITNPELNEEIYQTIEDAGWTTNRRRSCGKCWVSAIT